MGIVGTPRAAKLAGQRFEKLIVVRRVPPISSSRPARWECKCDCGGIIIACTADLRRGKVKGCGCLQTKIGPENPRFVHGATRPGERWPEHMIWSGIIQRCYNPRARQYKDYGGRGIRVCQRWRKSFLAFFKDMGKRPARHLTLDRENNDGNYSPGNCRWITRSEQQRNRRTSPKYKH